MANVDNPHGFVPYAVDGGGTFPLYEGTLQTSVTVAEGDALGKLSGYVVLADATSTGILGVAAHGVTGAAAVYPTILYVPASPNITFTGQCSGNLTQGLIGTKVGIEGTTGIQEIDEDGTTSVAIIIKLKGGSALGTNAEVEFKWVKSDFTGQA